MDKSEALEIYLKANDECEQYPDCIKVISEV